MAVGVVSEGDSIIDDGEDARRSFGGYVAEGRVCREVW